MTWGPVGALELLNPGSGLDALRLAIGHWLLIYNDTIKGRNRLAVSLSDDEGRTWKWTRHLEKQPSAQFHYPAIIQSGDGMLHAVYSYFVEGGKSMKHSAFNEAWVKVGESRERIQATEAHPQTRSIGRESDLEMPPPNDGENDPASRRTPNAPA
jgi:predicted neuraminidase